jgi:polyisoprenoid-binding protein YceI
MKLSLSIAFLAAALLGFTPANAPVASLSAPAGTWSVDVSHSNVQFTVTHLVISEVTGYFKIFEGTLVSEKPDFSDAKINFTVDVNSVNTDNEMRDGHLKSDDFFNAAQYPKMTFVSKKFEKVADKKYKLTGDLTIRDVTKTVVFDVTYGGTVKDPWGNTKAGFKAEATVNRFDYNLKWNTLTEAGAVVDANVQLRCNIELKLN